MSPHRQAQASTMAIQVATTTATLDPMGNSLSSMDAGQDEVSGIGFLLCNYGQSGHAYIFHGRSADSVLVRTYISG